MSNCFGISRWRGDVALYLANSGAGVSFTSNDLAMIVPDQSVAQIGDFTGSGRDSILWQHAAGNLTLWNAGAGPVMFTARDLGTVGASWHV